MTTVEVVQWGIVDGGVEDLVAVAVTMAKGLAARGCDGEAAEIRKAMWPALSSSLSLPPPWHHHSTDNNVTSSPAQGRYLQSVLRRVELVSVVETKCMSSPRRRHCRSQSSSPSPPSRVVA